MIYGIGVDIAKTSRFEKWISTQGMIERFFNQNELSAAKSISSLCQHYAARFAAKEAFSKALGTGLSGFSLSDVYIKKDENGKPYLIVENSAKKILENRCGKCRIHVSLSHEKEYALAYVIIESEKC